MVCSGLSAGYLADRWGQREGRGDGMQGERDAGQFARVGACELGANDIGVLRDAYEKVRVHVNSCQSTWVVIDD